MCYSTVDKRNVTPESIEKGLELGVIDDMIVDISFLVNNPHSLDQHTQSISELLLST